MTTGSRTSVTIRASEWTHYSPHGSNRHPDLAGLSLAAHPVARAQAEQLTRANIVSITEEYDGIHIATTSYVGRLSVGPIELTISPKVPWVNLLRLVRYAYRLNDVQLYRPISHGVGTASFQDLLIVQLIAEAAALLTYGLHREYEQRRQRRASPRGRIDFNRLSQQAAVTSARVPCVFHRRTPDTLLNQVLRAGLRRAAQVTTYQPLRVETTRWIRILEEEVSSIEISEQVLSRAQRAIDRRTARYRSALELIQLLHLGSGVRLGDTSERMVTVPGFSFDMNRLFQRLLVRFIRESIPEIDFREEYALMDMMGYDADRNPLMRRSPRPRPDFAVVQGRNVRLFDAKYRDLWQENLPRDMLYQLAVYALSQATGATATILYPTSTADAQDQRITIRDPLTRGARAYVSLRPVHLERLEGLVAGRTTSEVSRQRREFARYLIS